MDQKQPQPVQPETPEASEPARIPLPEEEEGIHDDRRDEEQNLDAAHIW